MDNSDLSNRSWLVVGLGNPGPEYEWTRHNIGFLAVDSWAERQGLGSQKWSQKFKGHYLAVPVIDGTQGRESALTVHLLKPQTFMNLSGESVLACSQFFGIPKERILVLHDEVDLEFSTLKLQKARGHGGHNGIRSIHQLLAGNEYVRLRLGVGKSGNPHISTADHVLGIFSKEEKKQLPQFLERSGEAIDRLLAMGFDKAATQVNSQG